MKKIFIYSVLALVVFVFGCSSSKKTTEKGKLASKEKVQTTNKGKKILDSKTQKSQTKERFGDTTIINVKDNIKQQKPIIVMQFDKASDNFEKGNYDEACEQIDMFTQTFAKGDSLQYESLFLKSECLIDKEEIEKAERILYNLYTTKYLPSSIMEKVLVRLGQVYCVEDRKKDAEKLFNKLKNKYPNSIYLPLANCEAVK